MNRVSHVPGFFGKHFEALGDKWAAVYDGNEETFANYLHETAKNSKVINGYSIFSDDGEEIKSLRMEYKIPKDSYASFHLLTQSDDEKKTHMMISFYPAFDGIKNEVKIGELFEWGNKHEGEMAFTRDERVDLSCFLVDYPNAAANLKQGEERDLEVATLAYSMEIAPQKDYKIEKGEMYELALENFLKKNPDKTRSDFPFVKLSIAGMIALIPSSYVAEFEYRLPVLSVEHFEGLGKKFIRIETYLTAETEAGEGLRSYIYVSEEVHKGSIPRVGDDIQGTLWIIAKLADEF